MKEYWVYILASKRRGTLYVGVTGDLRKRVWEHRSKAVEGFTRTYDVDKLVYYEMYNSVEDAIARETGLKRWKRQWKIELIENENSDWRDLYDEIVQ